MVSWLKIKYPFEVEVKEKLNAIIFIPVLCGLLFFLLQPYGFRFSQRMTILSIYGVIIIGCMALNFITLPIIFPGFFSEKHWTIGKSLLFFIITFFIIGIWVHVVHALIYGDNAELLASFSELLETVGKLVILGFIASSFYILIRYNIVTRQHLQLSQDMNEDLQSKLENTDEAGNQGLIDIELENESHSIDPKNLIMAKAEGNYVAFYTCQNNRLSSKLYRKTLSELAIDLKGHPMLFRCHRSFIINLTAIISSHGNSQGLSVKLKEIDQSIPVSRPRIKELKNRLQGLNK